MPIRACGLLGRTFAVGADPGCRGPGTSRHEPQSALVRGGAPMSDKPLEITTQIIDGQASRLEYPGIELQVVAGPDRGSKCRLDPGGTRIGTAAGSHLRVTDRTVSRLHCELRVVERSIRLYDSGSTNGTHVDGVRVYDAEIAP